MHQSLLTLRDLLDRPSGANDPASPANLSPFITVVRTPLIS